MVIPRAEYRFLGCPCLTWIFDICVAAQADLHLKASAIAKVFYGWKYSFPVEATKLGTMHLKYCLWESQEGVGTPLALLKLIVEMEDEGPGIKVLSHNSEYTKYAVNGFDEDLLEARKELIDFIRSAGSGKPLAQSLLAQGMIDADTGKLVQAKWDEPLPETVETSASSNPTPGDVVTKLMELGWAEPDAKQAVEAAQIPKNASMEDVIKAILKKSQ